jgi:ribonuclease HI
MMGMAEVLVSSEGSYTVYFDGASRGNPGHAGVGAIAFDKDHTVIAVVSKYLGKATNNVAEYTSLKEMLAKLEYYVKHKEGAILQLRCDSELVAKQLKGAYRLKHHALKRLYSTVKKMLDHYSSWEVEAIPREENGIADALANCAIDNALRGKKIRDIRLR